MYKILFSDKKRFITFFMFHFAWWSEYISEKWTKCILKQTKDVDLIDELHQMKIKWFDRNISIVMSILHVHSIELREPFRKEIERARARAREEMNIIAFMWKFNLMNSALFCRLMWSKYQNKDSKCFTYSLQIEFCMLFCSQFFFI